MNEQKSFFCVSNTKFEANLYALLFSSFGRPISASDGWKYIIKLGLSRFISMKIWFIGYLIHFLHRKYSSRENSKIDYLMLSPFMKSQPSCMTSHDIRWWWICIDFGSVFLLLLLCNLYCNHGVVTTKNYSIEIGLRSIKHHIDINNFNIGECHDLKQLL